MALALLRAVERAGYGVAVLVVLAFGTIQGVQTEVFTLNIPWLVIRIATIEAVATTVIFSLLVTLSGLLLSREVYTPLDPDDRLIDGPNIAAIVPAYRDADVIGESVGTLLESNYRNLEIVIVGERGDEETLAAARRFAERPSVTVLENRIPGSKAGAINDAVSRVDADYIATFDVDERIDPDFIPIAMYFLHEEDRDVFQARRVPRVTGPVEALAYCERLLFHASYKLVEVLGFTYCRTSSVAFTREAFETVGGLDYLATEDIDFAHTCFRAGLAVTQSRRLTNEMEAPHTLRDLWGQRKRWRLGHLQVFLKAIRFGYDHGGLRGKLSTARIVTSLLTSVFLVAFVGKVGLLILLNIESVYLLPFAATALTVLPVLVYDVKAGHVKRCSPALALAPLVYPGFGLLTLRSTFEYLCSWDGEWYQVEKTGA